MRILTIVSIPGSKLQQISLGEYVSYEQALIDIDNVRGWLSVQIQHAKANNQTAVPPPRLLASTDEFLDEYIQVHNIKFHDDGNQELL